MRVLFISTTGRLHNFYGKQVFSGWYESAFAHFGRGELTIGVVCGQMQEEPVQNLHAFDDPDISYFPFKLNMTQCNTSEEQRTIREKLHEVIEQFRPDLIQCFGAEYSYGLVAQDTNVPVVIHMMGFLNIYYPMLQMNRGPAGKPGSGYRKILSEIRRHSHALIRKITNAGFIPSEASMALVERQVMKANCYFLGRTDWDRRIVEYYSPGSRYFHVPEMIEYPFYQAAGQWHMHSGESLRLLTVSSADERKGNEIILQAAKLLKELLGIHFTWRVAGSRDFFPLAEEKTGIRGKDVQVELLGRISPERIVEELVAADFFIHPSLIDNSPIAICEAQLVGCPVIASCVGGVPQLVEHGVTGWLHPYQEPHTLAFLIADLASDPNTVQKVSQEASRMAMHRHNPERITKLMIGIYHEILDDREAVPEDRIKQP